MVFCWGCHADILSYTGTGHTNMLKPCHAEMQEPGHALMLTCWRTSRLVPEEVSWFWFVAVLCLHISALTYCRAEKVHTFEHISVYTPLVSKLASWMLMRVEAMTYSSLASLLPCLFVLQFLFTAEIRRSIDPTTMLNIPSVFFWSNEVYFLHERNGIWCVLHQSQVDLRHLAVRGWSSAPSSPVIPDRAVAATRPVRTPRGRENG